MKRAVEEEEEVIGMTDIFAEDIPPPTPKAEGLSTTCVEVYWGVL